MIVQEILTICIAAPTGVMRSSVRSFIQTIVDTQFLEFADTCEVAKSLVCEHFPDILILDYDLSATLPESEGPFVDWLISLRTCSPDTRTIMLLNDHNMVNPMLHAGAVAAFIKGTLNENLREAIQTNYGGVLLAQEPILKD